METLALASYNSPLQLSPRPKMLGGWLDTLKLEETALRIFLIFCMELGVDKLSGITEPDF